MIYSASHSSRIGNRKNNQDRCRIFTSGNTLLLVLADGLGGYKGGELAAQTVIDTMEQQFKKVYNDKLDPRQFLRESAMCAHVAVRALAPNEKKPPRTTCVCCLIKNGKVIWLHSGDSRLYLIRKDLSARGAPVQSERLVAFRGLINTAPDWCKCSCG